MITLNDLIEKSGLSISNRGGDGNIPILDICYDSRKVTSGVLYVSIPGTKVHGDTFIQDAIAKGAVAVISERPQSQLTVPWIQIDNPRNALGNLGKALWQINLEEMFVVGITGTNGKTTVAHLFEELFKKIYGQRVWMFGTIDYHFGNQKISADHTTPEALDIYRYVGSAALRPEGLVMEVSSHSLALDRISGLKYNCAIWTNLTQDHLDFHKTMESYYQAKKRLFTEYIKVNGCMVVNIDDPWGKRLKDEIISGKCIGYGQSEDADVRILSWHCDWEGCRVEVLIKGEKFTFISSLRGFFNVYNMTALIAGGIGSGATVAQIHDTFATIRTVPGRMDRVPLDAPFSVIVDYAHTPDALLNILQTSRPLTRGKLICVFGCGGDRDKTKRPIMGSVVADNCDEAFVTSDNPRSEKPHKITEDILAGIPLDFPHMTIIDRREAIRAALISAKEGDCIVIAGKGHEDYQEIQGVRHHFNDKEIVIELYQPIGNSK